MSEENKIFDEINEKDGLKKEQELFKELQKFEASTLLSSDSGMNKINIIDFFPIEEGEKQGEKRKYPLKLAAESSKPNLRNLSHFLISSDGKFAIKYIKRIDEEIHITILCDSDIDTDEILLYSAQLQKYFISNLKSDFVIGQYSSFNLNDFEFKAILPVEKLIIIKKDDFQPDKDDKKNLFSVLSYDNKSIPEVFEKSDTILKINTDKNFSIAVLQTGKTKDFVMVNKQQIEIPMMLLEQKSILLLY